MSYRDAPRVRVARALTGICRISLAAGAFAAVGVAAHAAAEDPRDIAAIMAALNGALEHERSGVEVPWSNAATGRAGTIRVERTFYRGQQPCRDYVRTTTGGGPGYQVRGVGCRLGKLNWGVEEAPPQEPAAKAASPAPEPAATPSGPAAAPESSARSGGPSGETASPRPARKPAAPQAPTLHYGLPTRSQL
jgi:surface antigen